MLKYQKAWKKKVKSGKAVNYSLRAFKIWLALLLLVIIFALWYQWELDHPVEIVSPVPLTSVSKPGEVRTVYATDGSPIYIKDLPADYKVSQIAVIKMIIQEFEEFGPVVVHQALNVAWCESKYKPEAENYNTNKTWDFGVFQINDIHGLSESDRKIAWINISYAKKLYIRQGWRPWVCARKLGYIK